MPATRLRILASAVCALALALPAAAQAAPGWQTFPDPPGRIAPEWEAGGPSGVAVSVVGATPYASWSRPNGLTVWHLNAPHTRWVQVGGRLDDPASTARSAATIVGDGSTTWAVWIEEANGRQLRVARLIDGQFEPIAAGSVVGSVEYGRLGIATWDGHLYLAYVDYSHGAEALRVVRVAADGSAYEPVMAGLPASERPTALGTAGGRLYLAYYKGNDRYELARLSSDGTRWDDMAALDQYQYPLQLIEHDGELHMAVNFSVLKWTDADGVEAVGPQIFDDRLVDSLASAGGVLYAAGTDGPAPDAVGFPRLVAFDGSSWQPMSLPYGADVRAGVGIQAASDGGLWLVSEVGDSSWGPFDVRVARYGEPLAPEVEQPGGSPAEQTPAGSGESSSGGGYTQPDVVPDNGGDDGFTTPDGTPATPPVARPPLGRGACANPLMGTARGERLVGSLLGDRIRGLGGADHLFGRSGSDCLWGGSGNDFVSGGGSADSISGGPGADRIAPGGGRDDVAAGSGADSINAVGGGVDRINCGAGFDTVKLSPNDLMKGCERVVVVRH